MKGKFTFSAQNERTTLFISATETIKSIEVRTLDGRLLKNKIITSNKNEYELNLAASTVSVNSARANQFMGYSLYVKANETSDREEKRQYLDQATLHIDKAISIYPTYSEANNAKAGLLAGYYQLDRDLDKLLDGFYVIQTRKLVPFVDVYLDYLEDRADRRKLNDFYRRLGTQLVKQGNRAKGGFYLEKMQ